MESNNPIHQRRQSMKLNPSPFAKSKRPSIVKDTELNGIARRESLHQLKKSTTMVTNEDLLDSYIKKLTIVMDEKTTLESKIKEQTNELENLKKNPKKFMKNFTCEKCEYYNMEIEDILSKFSKMRKKFEKEIENYKKKLDEIKIINDNSKSKSPTISPNKKKHEKFLNVNTKFKNLYFLRTVQIEFNSTEKAICFDIYDNKGINKVNNKNIDYSKDFKVIKENFFEWIVNNTDKKNIGKLFLNYLK